MRIFSCIIISGGPNSVYAENAPKYDPEIFNLGLPVLGICYGFQVSRKISMLYKSFFQLINKHFGGDVASQKFRKDGQMFVDLNNQSPLFNGLANKEKVLLTHGDSVLTNTVAPGFEVIAQTSQIVAGN